MAETVEDFVMRLCAPVLAIVVVGIIVEKILKWVWGTILSNGVPILWMTGILFTILWIAFIVFLRKGDKASGFGSLIFALVNGVVFLVVLVGGCQEKLPWAQRLVNMMGWVSEHPVLAGLGFVVLSIFAIFWHAPWRDYSNTVAEQCPGCEIEGAQTWKHDNEDSKMVE